MSKRVWTDEKMEFLARFVPGHHYKEIVEEFNKTFPDAKTTEGRIKSCISIHGLKTGFDGQFKKGIAPHNKGVKMTPEHYEKARRTMFKPGHKNVNEKPIGSERLSRDGYIEIKAKAKGKWKQKARYVWEQHNGKIPKGYVVLHLNQVQTDDRIENLRLVSRAELARLCQSHMLTDDAEINEASIVWAKLKTKLGERKRNKNGADDT